MESLKSLDRRIEALDLRLTNLRQGTTPARRAWQRARLNRLYRSFQNKVRVPRERYQFWSLGVVIVGPLIAGLLGAIVGHALTGWYAIATTGFLLLAAISAAVLVKTLYMTDDQTLARHVQEASERVDESRQLYDAAKLELTEAERLLGETRKRREELAASISETQKRLLQQNWKAMRDPEWERFLGTVFTTLEATVRHLGKQRDEGIEMIAEIGTNRYAIATIAYVPSVDTDTVERAIAGRSSYGCNWCTVITNSRFTPAAIDLAKRNGCILIGENEIPALVMGKLIL
jgi:HJR/Mrr/RecB family endonuclease